MNLIIWIFVAALVWIGIGIMTEMSFTAWLTWGMFIAALCGFYTPAILWKPKGDIGDGKRTPY